MKRLHKLILIFLAGVLLVYVLDQYFLVILQNDTCLNDHHIITALDGGQLGNNIWEYMSLFALTNLYKEKIKIVAYCPATLKAKVEYVFESLSIPGHLKISRYCFRNREMYTLNLNESLDFNKLANNSYHLVLAQWSARYTEVLAYGIQKIRNELRFRKRYIEHSHKVLNNVKESLQVNQKDITFVGMHYRGTDYVDLLKRNYNSFNGPPDYKFYLKAMDYFKQRYETVIFILITIDFNWLEKNLPFLEDDNNLIVNPGQFDTVKDLALLSHCNHSIINYGTFGATAALLSGGTTFVYDLGIPLDQRGPTVAMGIANILPNWYILKQT